MKQLLNWLFSDFLYRLYDMAENKFTLHFDPITVVGNPLPGKVGVPYTPAIFTVQPGQVFCETPPLTLTGSAPAIPVPGLSFSPPLPEINFGTMVGVPTTIGIFAFTLSATSGSEPPCAGGRTFYVPITGTKPELGFCTADLVFAPSVGNSIPLNDGGTLQFFIGATPITNVIALLDTMQGNIGLLQTEITNNTIEPVVITIIGFQNNQGILIFNVNTSCDSGLEGDARGYWTYPENFTGEAITPLDCACEETAFGSFTCNFLPPNLIETDTQPFTCTFPPIPRKKNSGGGGYPTICCQAQRNPKTGRFIPCPRIVKSGGFFYYRVSMDASGKCCYYIMNKKIK